MPVSNPSSTSYNPGAAFSPTSGYGYRDNPLDSASKQFHQGQDYGAAAGTPIPAASTDVVTNANLNKYFKAQNPNMTDFTKQDINVAVALANQDYSLTKPSELTHYIPTIADDSQEHWDVFNQQGIPIENWGGTTFAWARQNFVGSAATAAELENLVDTHFTQLSVDTAFSAYLNLINAGASQVLKAITNPVEFGGDTIQLYQLGRNFREISDTGTGLDGTVIDNRTATKPPSPIQLNFNTITPDGQKKHSTW